MAIDPPPAYLLAVYPAFQEKIYAVVNWLEEKTALLNYFTKAYHLDSPSISPLIIFSRCLLSKHKWGWNNSKNFPKLSRDGGNLLGYIMLI